jgi:type IV pilus assembly protein PilC
VWLLLRTTPGGRAVREAMVAGVPVVGRVYKASLIARFIRSVATCINAGVTLPEALRLAGGVTGSPRLITESSRVAEAAERGDSVFNATQLCGWIPAMFGYTIQAALGRQNLPTALMELSKAYEQRATHIQSMLRVLLFPALVCVVGLIIMMGIVALFLPLVTLINSVSGPA